MFARFAGTGSYLPPKVMDNIEIEKIVETSDEWIESRTGIKARHISEKDSTVTMAIKAATAAIEDSKIAAKDIDMVIVSTVSAEQLLPCIACEVQTAIGAVNAAAFDVNAACTGFITAYQIAAAQMQAGLIKTALLIGTECLSNILDWTDRGTCILFGDGAGAAIVTASEEGEGYPGLLHADGSKGSVLTCSARHHNQKVTAFDSYVRMDGQEIYKFAVKQVPKAVKEILAMSGKEAEEIDYFILHQANRRIIESIAKRLKQDISKFPMNMMDNGNMSSASIPVLLDTLHKEGKLKRGMKIIIAGFGAGLTWGGTYLEW